MCTELVEARDPSEIFRFLRHWGSKHKKVGPGQVYQISAKNFDSSKILKKFQVVEALFVEGALCRGTCGTCINLALFDPPLPSQSVTLGWTPTNDP